MGKRAPVLVMAPILLCVAGFASAQGQNPPSQNTDVAAAAEAKNRIVGYSAWDDDYIYFALQVNKPVLVGTNNEPFSNPLKDDAVILAFQTDDDRKTTHRTAHTYTIAVSEAGGVQIYSGADSRTLFSSFKEIADRLEQISQTEKNPEVEQAKRTALLSHIPKLQVTQKGAPRVDGSLAPGYTVEIGIPWADLGGKPEAGARLGFNVVAQSVPPSTGSPLLQSLSPVVKAASDLENPSLWGEIVLSNTAGASSGGALVSPRVLTNKPVINGELSAGEWNGLSLFTFGERASSASAISLATTIASRTRPDFVPHAPHPVVLSAGAVGPIPVAPHRPQKVAPLVLARYEYDYQADTRKAAPADHVARRDGSSALVHHPFDGAGPWLSYDRADWHRSQLLEARRVGIDVILPLYRGGPRDRQLYADKGLTVLATALEYLRQTDQEYPQVACYLDTDSLIATFGDRPDLRRPEAQAALYAMVRDFYRRIPEPFRYFVPLSAENGGRKGYVVFLSDAGAFKDFDATFADYLRSHFSADFDHADLVLLGGAGFKPRGGLDGYFTESKEKGLVVDGDGWIKTASINAGYASAGEASGPETAGRLPRRNDQTYRAAWTDALGQHPDWVFLPGWNDYGSGAEIAPSLELGYSTADLTKVFTRMFAGSARFGIKFLGHDAPSVLTPQNLYQIHVRAQNTGVDIWSAKGPGTFPVAFDYRWLRNGQVVAYGHTMPLPATILAGQDFNVALPVRASEASGAALQEGDYTLEIGAVEAGKRESSPFLESGTAGATLQIPIQVRAAAGGGAPQWAATLLSTDLPQMLESGGVYRVHATLRNAGTAAWRTVDGARVTLRLYRTAPGGEIAGVTTQLAAAETPHPAGGGATPVAAADATAELAQDVLPGQETTVSLLLPLTDPEGKPLPVWNQEDLWTYQLCWEVAADHPQRTAAPGTTGVCLEPTPVAVIDFDFGVRFTADATPPALPGDRRQPVRLALRNVGPQIWKRDVVRVGYHWFYEDGSEVRWEDETTAIPQDVPPGGEVKDLLAWVTAPPLDGNYFLVWDVKFGDTWASTAASTRAYDETLHPIQVVGGRLIFADLTRSYNLDGISDTDAPADGDFDGQGRSFPASLIPPYADSSIVPAAMWQPSEKTGPESPRRLSFRWGPKDNKSKNFIVCQGQRIELSKSAGPCQRLHILAASTGKDVVTNIKLIFQEPTSQSEDLYAFSVSRWDRPLAQNDEIAFLSPRHSERNGSQPGAVALYHYVITIREPRKLVAITLPNEPAIKIAAMTLEK